MNLSDARQLLNGRLLKGFDVYERRAGVFQIIVPILHEDGDMVEIYMQEPCRQGNSSSLRLRPSLMRLSYTFDPSTPARQRILDSILINNGINKEDGNQFMDSSPQRLHESILQYAGCVQKICNMRLLFHQRLCGAPSTMIYGSMSWNLSACTVQYQMYRQYRIFRTVDWILEHNRRSMYVFGAAWQRQGEGVSL